MLSVFIGQNTLDRDKAANAYINKFVSVNGDMALDKLNAEDLTLNDVIDAVTTVPFLSPRRMVVIKYLSANKDLADKLEQILNRLADTTELVIMETTLDNRSVYSKNLKKMANSLSVFENLDGLELADWAVKEVKKRGGDISKNDAVYLVDRLGQNQQIVSSELDKLLLLGPQISKENIDLMTESSPTSSVFNMIDSIMQGKVSVASKLYDEQRRQGMEPQAIMGMITWQLTILANVVAGQGDSPDTIAKRAKISPFVVRKNMNFTNKLTKSQIVNILDLAIKTDLKIKTGRVKPDTGVHTLLLDISASI